MGRGPSAHESDQGPLQRTKTSLDSTGNGPLTSISTSSPTPIERCRTLRRGCVSASFGVNSPSRTIEATSEWSPFDGAAGVFHDNGDARVSLVSTATIAGWDRRRFRANVLLDGEGEDALVGSKVRLGDAVLELSMRLERCVMTTRPQPDGIERDLDVLRTINRDRGGCLAIGALVAQPGVVHVGDPLNPL